MTSEGFPAPTGTISFENASTGNAVLGTASLGNAVPGFASNVTYGTSGAPDSVAVGDFNGDGIPDLAIADDNNPSGTVEVLLGNGDGTYKPAVSYSAGDYAGPIAVGDFNNDGNLDLVAGGSGEGGTEASVLLGNGDGTFQPAVSYNAGAFAGSVAVGDFNGDGNLDLAVTNQGSVSTVSVLLGDGTGAFGSPTAFDVASQPTFVTVGDFNGDGKLDLVAANGGNSVSVLLGNGDGTFQTQVSYPTGITPYSIAVGDVNGDGFLDLAVANNYDNTVSVLLGNGNGTFQTQTAYATGYGPSSVVIADLNGDGKPDLAVTNYSAFNENTGMFNAGNTVSVLLGDGTGAFGTATSYTIGNAPFSVAARDLNSDGAPDLAVANSQDGTVSVLLNQFTTSASLSGVTIPGSGTQNVFASYGGDTNYSGSNSGNLPLQGSQIDTATEVSSSLNPSNSGQAVTFTATLFSNGTPATSADGRVSFSSSISGNLGTWPVNNGVALLVTGSLPAGSQTITANYAGYGNYGPSFGFVT